MSKPVYEIPVNGDEAGAPPNFPPPTRTSRTRNLSTAPPPSSSGHAPTYPTEPAAPFTSPPPTIAPQGSWPAPNSTEPPLPPTPGLVLPPDSRQVFTAPLPDDTATNFPAPSG
ncbi:MAG TPA: hypothetical protein VHU90_01120, partial [Galbitalea sp.]|nr:hypothetical protein [Galbitalea sp.]